MPERTKKQIEAEINALQACKAYIPRKTIFGDDNHRNLDLQIEMLRGEIDMTAGEWDELSSDEQSTILEAKDWLEGQIEESPSSGWDNYKPSSIKKRAKP